MYRIKRSYGMWLVANVAETTEHIGFVQWSNRASDATPFTLARAMHVAEVVHATSRKPVVEIVRGA